MKAYISDHGLPRAVVSTDALPINAFVGFLCYVETGNDKGLYQYDGSAYALVNASATPTEDPADSPPTVTVVTEYDTVTEFPSADASAGELAYATSTNSVYYYNGSAWKKLSVDSGVTVVTEYDTVSAFPSEDTSAGELAYATSTKSVYYYNGSSWKKLTADSGVVVAPSYEAVASFPESPTAGQMVWCTDATDGGLYVYDGTAWKKVTVA
jgi:hypothetical protein